MWPWHRKHPARTADEALRDLLTPRQRHRLHQLGEIRVTGSAGGRYVIRRYVPGVVYQLPEWTPLSATVHGRQPTSTTIMISQVVALLIDEPDFLCHAHQICE